MDLQIQKIKKKEKSFPLSPFRLKGQLSLLCHFPHRPKSPEPSFFHPLTCDPHQHTGPARGEAHARSPPPFSLSDAPDPLLQPLPYQARLSVGVIPYLRHPQLGLCPELDAAEPDFPRYKLSPRYAAPLSQL